MSYLASGGASMISGVRGMHIMPDGLASFLQGLAGGVQAYKTGEDIGSGEED